ncbi:MAG TPA: hypothetical protein VIJ66_05290 [Solirubrobacteraceae bacterium]
MGKLVSRCSRPLIAFHGTLFALLAFFLALSAAPALAAPSWGITVTAQNPFGAVGLVEPFSGSGTTFARGSGFNTYTITVKNEGTETVGGAGVGGTLSCVGSASSSQSLPAENAGATVAYRWLRDGAEIGGATGAAYKLVAADEGKAVQCEVTASNAAGSTVTISRSSLVSPIPSTLPPEAGYVVVEEVSSGGSQRRVGETVRCETGAWAGSPTSYVFQWLRGGVPISGATVTRTSSESLESVYALTAVDAGKAIQCEVTATNAGGSTAAVDRSVEEYGSNTAAVAAPPANSAAPALSGTASIGETLSCGGGAWKGAPTPPYEYQWLRNGSPISTATSSTYTLVSADEGKAIQCEVTAANAEGATSAVSAQDVVSTGPSTVPPTNTGAPEFYASYPDTVGDTTNCYSPGSWEGEPTSYVFQWLRGGVPISGGTVTRTSSESLESEYTLTAADAGKAIQCEVTATNAGGSVSAISAGEAFVVKPPLPAASATIPPTPSVSVADQLPAGLVLAGREAETEASGAGWSCAIVAGNGTVTCTRSDLLAAGAAYPPITLHVHVHDEAPLGAPPSGGVTNVAAVYGGGASASASDPTTIGPAVAFGIESFTTSVTESLGGPFTQAGGHPFAASTTFVFNSTTDDNGHLKNAGGDPREVEAELPPGFVGDPQAAAKCPLAVFQRAISPSTSACAEGTQVGFVAVALNGTPSAGPEYRSLSPIYNLQPAPGHPAEFGFLFSTQAFVLDASVRSDGDYGITVGDNGTPDAPTALAIKLTLCENGSTFSESPKAAACRAVAAGSTPFLTNPTQCSGRAPVTTLRVNSYAHPASYVSKTVYNGTALVGGAPSASESFVTGCDLLQFQPEVQFKPSPASEGGTTQADEPTGMRFKLEVPQADQPVELKAGSTVACLSGSWSGSPSGYAYQWLDDGTPISGASASTYAVQAADAGHAIQCEVTATNAGGGSAGLATPIVVPPPPTGAVPANTVAPTVSSNGFFGTVHEGNTLTCAPGTWTGGPSFTYQWLKNGTPIAGETNATYVVKSGDVSPKGSALQCQVTATNAGGAVAAVSANKNTTYPHAPSPAVPVSSTAPQVSITSAPNATPELKNATVTLPVGMTVDPSAADGLQACSNAQFGLGSTVEPAEAASCPAGSKIGTVKVITPLLEKPLEGEVFVGEPECAPCSPADAEDGRIFKLFLQVRSVELGVLVKLAGKVSANPVTGQLQATFTQQPQLPFSELLLTLNGGARAPLANPQTCGAFTTTTDLTPWSAPGVGGLSGTEAIAGTPDATPSSPPFNVDWNGAGGACPASLPFGPSFSAGSQTPTAGASSPFSVTFGREDREQDISAITVSTPPGLLGKIAGIPQCPEAQANAGMCGPESEIGTTTVGAGPGPHPFYVGGRVYLTGPYKGGPFGLSVVVPAIAGPFNLGTVVVRASIAVNPATAALTIASDPLPQFVDGVQLRLRRIDVEVNRPGFMLNPTSCAAQSVGTTITAAQGASSTLSSPFEVGACQNLAFSPSFSASTQAKASKAGGASLTVVVRSTAGQANIAKVDLALPKQLPSRLTTLQKACTAAVFDANPAGCSGESIIGTARALTPVLNAPLEGPAYLVSHGGAAFPDVEFVLQGEGVEIVLDGQTDIKNGITYSKFETVPDAPVSLFETSLPEGPHSILGTNLPASANYSLCGQHLTIPTIITAQNGKQIKQTTKLAVTGCTASKPTSKPTVKITRTKLKGDALLVTVKTSAKGRVRISGKGLKTTVHKNVKAGTHRFKVTLTRVGRAAKRHRKKTKLRASLTVGKQAVATTISVKL